MPPSAGRRALLLTVQRPGNGCGGWTRTSDPRVMSPVRYQLRHPATVTSTVPALRGETAFIVLLHHRSQPSLRACATASFFISIHRESCCRYMLGIAGGEEEIRTLVAFPPIRLPSDAVRPLRHLSSKIPFTVSGTAPGCHGRNGRPISLRAYRCPTTDDMLLTGFAGPTSTRWVTLPRHD